MARGFDKLHIKSAVTNRSKMQFDPVHLTTMDFGQIVPLFFNELVPGDEFNINSQYFSRMAPLVKPTYGKFYFKTASFFVPFFQLADDAEAFVNGQTVWEGSTPLLRYIPYTELVTFLNYSSISSTVSSSVSYDWHYVTSSGTDAYKVFTPFGKYCLKVLNSLGYSIPQNINMQTTSSWYTAFGSKVLNALPLLAFAKAYNDYMSQSQRYNSSQLTAFLKAVKHRMSGNTGFNSATCYINFTGLLTIFNNIKLCYENDYFTSAWQSPNNSLSGAEDLGLVYVPQTAAGSPNVDYVVNGLTSTYLSSDDIRNNGQLTQRALDYLKRFDDWVRRNNFSGSRIVQKVYSRFGIKTEDFRSNYAHCLGTSSTPLQIGDVTATASSDVTIGSSTYNNVVGDYAGKGIVSDNYNLSFKSSDWGYLMIFGYYTIAPMMSYGFDRTVLRTSPLDFFTPEFDGLGADAISFGEVFSNPIADSSDSTLDNQVYGFTEKYNDYRFMRDRITGEMRDFHSNGDMNVWHSGRLLNDVRKNGNMIAQSSSMNTMDSHDSEFNRIFSVVDGSNDHFYMTAKFNVNAVRPMMSLNQVPRLGEGDTVVDKNGNVIN